MEPRARSYAGAGLALALALVGCGGAMAAEETTPSPPPPSRARLTEDDAIRRAMATRDELCGSTGGAAGEASAAAEAATRAWPFPSTESEPPTDWLVVVPCFDAAYQPNQRLAHVDRRGEVRPLALPIVTSAGSRGESLEVARVELEGDALTEVSLDRGLGDCGRLVRARLVAPSRLVFVEQRQRACSDTEPPEGGPEAWPLVPVVDSSRVDAR